MKKTSQTYMFDMDDPAQDTRPLIMKEPSKEQLERVTSLLAMSNKDTLVQMCQVFHPLLNNHISVRKRKADGTVVEAPELVALKKYSMPKADISNALAFMLAEPENIRLYTDTLSEETRALWRLILVRLFVSMDDAREVLKTTDKLSSREGIPFYHYYGYNSSHWHRKELSWFDIVYRYSSKPSRWNGRERAWYITLSPNIHRIFFPIFFPDAYADHSIKELPEGEFLTITGEADALRCYPVVAAMLAGGELALGSGRYLVTGQKVAVKRTALKNFGIGETPDLRAILYVQMLTLCHVSSHPNKNASPPDQYKTFSTHLVKNIGSDQYYMPLFIFAHINGLRRSFIEENLCPDLAVHDMRLMAAHDQKWVPIRDFYMHSFFGVGTSYNVPFPPLVFNITRDDYHDDLVNTFTDQPLAVDFYTRHFGNTFHKGFLYILATLGLVELACQKPVPDAAEKPISPYAAIAYARLSPLGRYALGLTKDYDAPQQQKRDYFLVDDQRLIVRDLCVADGSSTGTNPYLEILKDIARPIGSGRYEVTPQTFLSPCSTNDDVLQRIKNFRQFVCPKPPTIWETFFSTLLTRCHPLTLNHEDFHVYTLPADDHDLQRLVATDPKLRQLVIRAEGYRILVRTIDLGKFRTRLKALGYLL